MDRLLEVLQRGEDVDSLRELIEKDPLILDRVFTGYCDTPLHIVAMYGHVELAKEILKMKPELLSEIDVQAGFTPLHLACARKNVDMVKLLLEANPDVCIVQDQDGRTPLHLAAMKGRVEIMELLIETRPEAIQMLQEQSGETILHFCVKHNCLDPLKLLVDSLEGEKMMTKVPKRTDDDDKRSAMISVNSKDHDGNTILHLAVAKRQIEMVDETPPGIASSYNNLEIIKFLIDEDGTHKIELEAENTNGETPLHVAAKNGFNEAIELLVGRGALLDAKANNGMTPLHFAVLYSLEADDFLIVKTLLERNADCSVEDEDGKIPLDHVSQEAPEDEKLRELLHAHLLVQRRSKAIEACEETRAKLAKLEDEISNIVGLHDLKLQLRKWAKGILLDVNRMTLRPKIAARRSPHMAFLGNPGTGKTMVARIFGRILHTLGIIPTDKVTEVQRTDLVGEYIGHTGVKTRDKIEEAEGGILFVDEAYRLIPNEKGGCSKDYGIEALEEIMSFMDNGKIVVIFAGYKDPMMRVISSNEGFRRRVTKYFFFEDFSCEELAQIVQLKMTNNQGEDSLFYGFKLHPSCKCDDIAKLIEKETTERQRKEMNGGIVDTMLVNAMENLNFRLDSECKDENDLFTITMEDLEAGLKSISQV